MSGSDQQYRELASTYRFFLTWRHAAVVALVVFLWGAGSLTFSALGKRCDLAWWVPAVASILPPIVWWIDRRTQALYWLVIESGAKLEGDTPGLFRELRDARETRSALFHRFTSHSTAIATLCLFSTIALVSAACYLYGF